MGDFRKNQFRKTVLAGAASMLAMMAAAPGAMAQEPAQSRADQTVAQTFNLSEGPLGDALFAITTAFNVNIIADETLVEGKTAPAISGVMTAEEALDRALEGSGLTVNRSESGAYVVSQQSAAAEPRLLDTIVVTGSREYLYREDRTEALGFDATLAELPVTVNVVTNDFLEDTAAFDIEDILTFVPGTINGGSAGGTQDVFIIRGFANSTRFVNGLRQFSNFQQRHAIDIIERVEIIKGPAGGEFGVADAGGTLNIVTKKPQSEFAAQVFAGIGNEGYRRIGGDITGPILENGDLRYRLIAAFAQTAEWRLGRTDGSPRFTIAPSLAWDYAPGSSVLFEYEYTKGENFPDRGIYYMEGAGFEDNDNFAPRDYSFHANEASAAEAETEVHRFDLRIDQRLTDIFSIELAAQRQDEQHEVFAINFPSIGNAYAADGLTWDGVTTDVAQFTQDDARSAVSDNISAVLRASFETGTFEHGIRAGYQYSDGELNVTYGIDGGDGRRIVTNTISLFDPDPTQQYVINGRDTARLFQQRQKINSFFGQWSVNWADRARFLFSVRNDDSEFTQLFQSTTSSSPSGNSSNELSFRVSGSYDIAPSVAVFAGYSDSYNPQTGTTREGGQIDPLHNTSIEAGIKTELFGGNVLWTNTVYQITRDNIAAADPNDPSNMFSIPFGEVRIRGFESEFIGSATRSLDVSAGLTIQESENTRTEDPSVQGNEFTGVPNFQASIFANYDFSDIGAPGLSSRIGLVHVGEREGSPLNNFQLPEYTRVDLGLRYTFNGSTSIDFFVENVFDEFIIEQAQGRVVPSANIIPGDIRLWQLNLRHQF